ncbi:MAG TPA: hypothetical protein VFU80_03615, partial [Sphingomicrobium sp.]|nr:hypothetical protein [Sphingomicrobium sp.]
MLGIDFIKGNREAVARAIEAKNVQLDLGELLALDTQVRALKTEIDALRAERNAISGRFKDASAEEKAELGTKAKEAGARASQLEEQMGKEQETLRVLLMLVPNIPWDGAPVGPDESHNTVVRTVGE